MPDKPTWSANLEEICRELEALPSPWIDRRTLEQIMGLQARRAQQLMAPVISRTIGRNGLADRAELIAHLRRTASGEAAYYERQRRRKLGQVIETLRRSWMEQPRVLVEAPNRVINQEVSTLPPGVQLKPGCILLEFKSKDEALAQLLALVMAIGNDPDTFEAQIKSRP